MLFSAAEGTTYGATNRRRFYSRRPRAQPIAQPRPTDDDDDDDHDDGGGGGGDDDDVDIVDDDVDDDDDTIAASA